MVLEDQRRGKGDKNGDNDDDKNGDKIIAGNNKDQIGTDIILTINYTWSFYDYNL